MSAKENDKKERRKHMREKKQRKSKEGRKKSRDMSELRLGWDRQQTKLVYLAHKEALNAIGYACICVCKHECDKPYPRTLGDPPLALILLWHTSVVV